MCAHPTFLQVLWNVELISVNQDTDLRQGMGIVRVSSGACGFPQPLNKSCELWHRPAGADGAHHVILFNPNDLATGPLSGPNVSYSVAWSDIGLPSNAAASVRDLWLHKDLGTYTGSYNAVDIQPHEARTLKVTLT